MKKLLLFLFIILPVNSYSFNYRFQRISIEQGLSNLNINALCEDNQGYIWVGTQRGLNRYNGYEFQHFYFDRSDSIGLLSDKISSLYCSSDDKLYIGTNKGLSCYNLRKQKFTDEIPFLYSDVRDILEWNNKLYVATGSGLFCIENETKDAHPIIGDMAIHVLYIDNRNQLWCGCNQGLIKITEQNEAVYSCVEQIAEFRGHPVLSIAEGYLDNTLWLGTEKGVMCFNKLTNKIENPEQLMVINSEVDKFNIQFIIERESGVYWIASYKSGLFQFDATKGIITKMNNPGIAEGLKSSNFSSVLIDNAGNTWLGTFDNGLQVSYKHYKNFNPDANLNQLTKDKFVTSITKSAKGELLISTRGNGFFVYDGKTGDSKHFFNSNSHLHSDFIKNLNEDKNGRLWIGTLSGVQTYDMDKGKFQSQVKNLKIGYSSFYCDKRNVYLGVSGLGLLIYDDSRKLVFESKQWGTNITRILPMDENRLLFTSYGQGIYLYNKTKKTAQPLSEIEMDDEGFKRIVTGYIDKQGVLWLGSYAWGLYKIDVQSGKVVNYNIHNGLPSNDVIGIVEDQFNNLWLSTSYGLSRFDKNTERFNNYFINEGVNNTQFHEKSAFRGKDGTIYFGGNYGLTYFYPEQLIVRGVKPPNVVIEEFRILNKTVMPSQDSKLLQDAVAYSKKITLSHKQKEFSFKLTAFDFLSPEQVQYAYKMEGIDDSWKEIGHRRLVSFANLKPGKYTFSFKAKSSGGEWSESSEPLEIVVKPAPWASPWAIIGYLLFIGFLTWGVFRFLIRLKLYRHELELEQREHQRENEVHEMKLRFFTNISHEFRTPLTIISGLTNQLLDNYYKNLEKRQVVKSLEANVNRMLKLVNQILVFRELENDTLQLNLKRASIAGIIQETIKSFEYYASKKQIEVNCKNINDVEIMVDSDKVDKILSNLISNAIKFTPSEGSIKIVSNQLQNEEVQIKYQVKGHLKSEGYYEISVIDSGPGLPEVNMKDIFKRYKKYGQGQTDYSGTGIGLDFCKKLVEYHNGYIKAKNLPDRGAVFSFVIPVETLDYIEGVHVDEEDYKNGGKQAEILAVKKKEIPVRKNKNILVVEDDIELNQLISESLSEYFSVSSCFDGAEALEQVKKDNPFDLIVSDVMMPKVDGIQLCKELKGSDKYGHIPFVLLSAKTDVHTQISGLNVGADVYVPKPFDINYVLALIDSQLENREKIHRIFMNGAMPKFEKEELNQRDISFLQQVNGLIEENYAQSDYNVSNLANMMHMSRSTFYRKFIALTNVTPNDYIKKFKVNKAAELLKTNNYSIAEVSELAGFATQGYFSTSFKNEMGITPRAFVKESCL